MRRILITGGSGLLGANCAKLASSRYETWFTFNAHPVQIGGCKGLKLDITDAGQVKAVVNELKPDAILNAAALLPARLCEENPDYAYRLHVDAVRTLGLVAKETDARIVSISTDWVFDGSKTRYTEEDVPNPLSVYGRSKLAGEQALLSTGAAATVVRTSLFGWNVRPGKHSYVEAVIDALGSGKPFRAPSDQYLATMLVNHLAEAIFEILERGITGLLHVTSTTGVSRYELAVMTAEVFGLDKALVEPVPIDATYFGVEVPRHQTLDVSRASNILRTRLPSTREGLEEMRRLRDSGYVDSLRSGR